MIDPRTIQTYLKTKGVYSGLIDGNLGPVSAKSMKTLLTQAGVNAILWTPFRIRIGTEQLMMTQVGIDVGKVDGILGPRYQYGVELYQNYLRDQDLPAEAIAHQKPIWPRQKDIESFYGPPGTNQVKITTPYPLFLDWDMSVKISGFMIHAKCADSAVRAMKAIHAHYGDDGVQNLGLNQFGGCLNVRKMRGGTRLSMHSWGCAIDWDADRNSLRMDKRTARLARPEFQAFWKSWYDEGWISLGLERGYDFMHVQAARL